MTSNDAVSDDNAPARTTSSSPGRPAITSACVKQSPTTPTDPERDVVNEAFTDAANRAQQCRPPSAIWGDESDAVSSALAWAAEHTVAPSDPKHTARSASDLMRDLGQTVTPDGIGYERALELFDRVIVPATRAADDPMNLAYIPGAPTRAAVAFDTAVSAANIYAGIWEAGAGAICAENQALRWILDLLEWPESAGGVFVSGGTSGNLSALATARQTARTWRGRRPANGWKLVCAESAHSSVRSSASLLDIEVVTVPADAHGHLTGAAVEQACAEHPEIIAVVASAGSTNAGIVDDIASITEVAHRRGIWVHVDGAYGGAALAAPSARERFAGIEQADSFIVDPHKWLFAPYDCCALLYRDPALASAAHSQHADYLDQIARDESNPADLAAHLSRRARGLPLWYSLATHGTNRYTAAVERCLDTARTVARAIEAMDHLELALEPELSVVVFFRPGWDAAAYQRWSDRLSHSGQILCIPTRHGGRTALRLAFTNPETDPQAVIEVLGTTMNSPDGS
ncbi:pyridoxal phosphate-dependent decarboxylase family protein [Devriesea agamarum]|uniref:pyridoxal phosphate-dependent decarboxylase family protein n=1 Tax=Devriesea agamarum TaxID=472569 RepID=UPI001E35814B|nr:aminotransferase class V-fold PLP-dependent enzyme [Devriesea agamarum]